MGYILYDRLLQNKKPRQFLIGVLNIFKSYWRATTIPD